MKLGAIIIGSISIIIGLYFSISPIDTYKDQFIGANVDPVFGLSIMTWLGIVICIYGIASGRKNKPKRYQIRQRPDY